MSRAKLKDLLRGSCPEELCIKCFLAKVTEKELWRGLIFNKIADLQVEFSKFLRTHFS